MILFPTHNIVQHDFMLNILSINSQFENLFFWCTNGGENVFEVFNPDIGYISNIYVK